MCKKVLSLVALSVLALLGIACARQIPHPVSPPTSDNSMTNTDRHTYLSEQYHFSFTYAKDWVIQRDDYREIILVPTSELTWQPTLPADISGDPKIQLALGEFAMQGVFETMPQSLTSDTLRARLEERVTYGANQDLSEILVDQQLAFQITEHYDPGCERVIYWRPDNLESVIKISTGCESAYLSEFEYIVNSLQSVE